MSGGRLVTSRAAAEILGVSLRTVERLLAAGELRPVRIGTRVFLTSEELDAFIARNQVTAARPRPVLLPWRADRRR